MKVSQMIIIIKLFTDQSEVSACPERYLTLDIERNVLWNNPLFITWIRCLHLISYTEFLSTSSNSPEL